MAGKSFTLYSKKEALYLQGFALPNMPVYTKYIGQAMRFPSKTAVVAMQTSLRLDRQLPLEVTAIMG